MALIGRDLQERSYLTNGVCGAGNDRACPGPGVPIFRDGDSNATIFSFKDTK